MTEEFGQKSFVYKQLYIFLLGRSYGWFIMSGFCFVDMGQIASGIGYDGGQEYNKYSSLDYIKIETSSKSKDLMNSWNKRI